MQNNVIKFLSLPLVLLEAVRSTAYYSNPWFCQGELTEKDVWGNVHCHSVKENTHSCNLLFLRSIIESCASVWALHCYVEAIAPDACFWREEVCRLLNRLAELSTSQAVCLFSDLTHETDFLTLARWSCGCRYSVISAGYSETAEQLWCFFIA